MFQSGASNLGPADQTVPVTDVYLYDRQTATFAIVSASTQGVQATHHAVMAAVSGNGEVVAFGSAAPNLVVDDTNGLPDVFVHRAG
ncbi:MAG: hypothetical protein QOE45_1400 [Frankiaceae bacterium]|nr:hypothetical protein [Frankiaceae bacterium]